MVYRNKLAMGNRPISDESDEWEITVGCWGGELKPPQAHDWKS